MEHTLQQKPLRCIVKLGGAAITHKDQLESIDVNKLAITCSQLRQTMVVAPSESISMDWSRSDSVTLDTSQFQDKQMIMEPFVVIHGAGSFGHFQASKSNVHKGGIETMLGKAGFVATRISVTKLNHEVVRALASYGIPAVGISPFSAGWATHNRSLDKYEVSMLRSMIDAGLVPVLHGDAVFDSGQGCNILSGDVVLRKLAEELKPLHAVFLTDVPGVFDRPPSEPDAVLLREIVVKNDGSWIITRPSMLAEGVEMNTAEHDTTGGMATKIAEATNIARTGVSVYIVQAGTKDALEAFQCCSWSKLSPGWVGTVVRSSDMAV